MTPAKFEKGLIVFFRLAMAWTFLYAGLRQVFFSLRVQRRAFPRAHQDVPGALRGVRHRAMGADHSFLVKWAHLLIAVSLLAGLFVRASAVFGRLLLGMYWMARMNFPYIETKQRFVIEHAGLRPLLG